MRSLDTRYCYSPSAAEVPDDDVVVDADTGIVAAAVAAVVAVAAAVAAVGFYGTHIVLHCHLFLGVVGCHCLFVRPSLRSIQPHNTVSRKTTISRRSKHVTGTRRLGQTRWSAVVVAIGFNEIRKQVQNR